MDLFVYILLIVGAAVATLVLVVERVTKTFHAALAAIEIAERRQERKTGKTILEPTPEQIDKFGRTEAQIIIEAKQKIERQLRVIKSIERWGGTVFVSFGTFVLFQIWARVEIF